MERIPRQLYTHEFKQEAVSLFTAVLRFRRSYKSQLNKIAEAKGAVTIKPLATLSLHHLGILRQKTYFTPAIFFVYKAIQLYKKNG